MARLLYPDEGNRFVYRLNGNALESATSASAIIYLDEACTTLANIASYSGANPGPVIATSMVVTDAFSRLPLFWGPDNVDTLYAVISGGPVTPIYARFDGRIDDIDAQLSTLGVSGYLTQPYASPLVPQNASASFISVGELIADMTIAAPTSHGGNALTLQFAQGAVPHQVVWNSEFNTTWQPTPTPYTVSTITFRWSGTRWEVISTGSPEGSGTPRSIQFALANFSASATLTAVARALFSGAASFSASATLSAASAALTEFRIWPTVSGPSTTTNDGAAVNLATEFYVTSAASLKRFWIWSTGNYPAEGAILTRLWTVASDGLSGTAVPGTDLAFGTSLPSGWVSLDLPTPVALTPNQHYRAVGSFPGTYAGTTGYFSGTGAGAAGFSSGALVVPNAAGASGGMQGSYANGAGRQFPGLTWNGSNYWIDVSVAAGALGPPVFTASASLSAQQNSPAGTLVEPTALTTGPRSATTTNITGDYTISGSNLTLSGLNISGRLCINGSNITLIDSYVGGQVWLNAQGPFSGQYPSNSTVTPVTTNVTMRYCNVENITCEGMDGLTIEYCHIRGPLGDSHCQLKNTQDANAALIGRNLTYRFNFHDNPRAITSGAHLENLHLMGWTTATVQGNSFNMICPDATTYSFVTGCMFGEPWSTTGDCTNVVIDNNWFRGGGVLQLYKNFTGNSKIINNKFFYYLDTYFNAVGTPVGSSHAFNIIDTTGNTYTNQSGVTSAYTVP